MQKALGYLKQNVSLVIVIVMVIVGFGLYANTFHNQMFWDDDDFILNNQYVRNFDLPKIISQNVIAGSNLISNYWRPVLSTVFAIEWRLWHTNVFGWHLVNTGFHIADAILIFYLFLNLFKKKWLAFLTSLIFLIHPQQTEAVSYVNSLGDSLSVFFILSGLLLYLKYLNFEEHKSNSYPYIFSLVFYALALMSKETAFVMPGLLILIDCSAPIHRLEPINGHATSFWKWFNNTIKNLWPHFVIAGIYLFLRATALNFKNTFNLYGSEQTVFSSHLYVRIFTFFKIILTYFGLLLYPHNLHMERYIDAATKLDFSVAAGAIIFFGLMAFAFIKFKKYPIISFGILWFFICLAPTSNILIPINGLLYEHWLYLPMVGFWLAILALGSVVARRFIGSSARAHKWARCAFYLLITIYFSLFAHQTIARNRQWHDPITFYNQTLQYAPNSYRVINNLGMAYADKGQIDEAIKTYNKAITVDQTNPVAFHNLANAYKSLNQNNLAITNYERAIELDPGFTFSYGPLVNIFIEQKNYKSALYYLRAFQKYSNDPQIGQLIMNFQNICPECSK